MFVSMGIFGFFLGLAGIYCLNMAKQSDWGWLCGVFGVLLCLISVGLPITAIIGAFEEKEITEAIICIVIVPLQFISDFFFARSLWW